MNQNRKISKKSSTSSVEETSPQPNIDDKRINIKTLTKRFSLNNSSCKQKQHKIIINLKEEAFKKNISYPFQTEKTEPVLSRESQLSKVCIDALTESINRFAFDFYGQAAVNALKNVVISPLSLFYLLKIFYLTSDEEKAEAELSRLLHLDANTNVNKSFLEKSFLTLLDKIKVNTGKDFFKLESSGYAKENFLPEKHVSKLAKNFGFDLDEKSDALASVYCKMMSDYNENESLSSTTNDLFLILSNLVEFDLEWKTGFDATSEKGTFTKSNNEKIKIELMRINRNRFMYAKNPKGLPLRICEFPFKNEALVFTLLLPEKNALTQIESLIDNTLFNELIGHMKMTEVNSMLPKFEISDHYDLVKILNGLKADSLLDFNCKEDGLCIDKAFFKSQINVSYMSASGSSETNMVLSRNPDEMHHSCVFDSSCEEFNCQNPFMFYIRNVNTKLILFMGKLLVPTNISSNV